MENKLEKEFADKHLGEMLKFVDDIITSTTEQYHEGIIRRGYYSETSRVHHGLPLYKTVVVSENNEATVEYGTLFSGEHVPAVKYTSPDGEAEGMVSRADRFLRPADRERIPGLQNFFNRIIDCDIRYYFSIGHRPIEELSSDERHHVLNALTLNCNDLINFNISSKKNLVYRNIPDNIFALKALAVRWPQEAGDLGITPDYIGDLERDMEDSTVLYRKLDELVRYLSKADEPISIFDNHYALPHALEMADGKKYTSIGSAYNKYQNTCYYLLFNDEERLKTRLTNIPMDDRRRLLEILRPYEGLARQEDTYFQRLPALSPEAGKNIEKYIDDSVKKGGNVSMKNITPFLSDHPSLEGTLYGSPLHDYLSRSNIIYKDKDVAIIKEPGEKERHGVYKRSSPDSVMRQALSEGITSSTHHDVLSLLSVKGNFNTPRKLTERAFYIWEANKTTLESIERAMASFLGDGFKWSASKGDVLLAGTPSSRCPLIPLKATIQDHEKKAKVNGAVVTEIESNGNQLFMKGNGPDGAFDITTDRLEKDDWKALGKGIRNLVQNITPGRYGDFYKPIVPKVAGTWHGPSHDRQEVADTWGQIMSDWRKKTSNMFGLTSFVVRDDVAESMVFSMFCGKENFDSRIFLSTKDIERMGLKVNADTSHAVPVLAPDGSGIEYYYHAGQTDLAVADPELYAKLDRESREATSSKKGRRQSEFINEKILGNNWGREEDRQFLESITDNNVVSVKKVQALVDKTRHLYSTGRSAEEDAVIMNINKHINSHDVTFSVSSSYGREDLGEMILSFEGKDGSRDDIHLDYSGSGMVIHFPADFDKERNDFSVGIPPKEGKQWRAFAEEVWEQPDHTVEAKPQKEAESVSLSDQNEVSKETEQEVSQERPRGLHL